VALSSRDRTTGSDSRRSGNGEIFDENYTAVGTGKNVAESELMVLADVANMYN